MTPVRLGLVPAHRGVMDRNFSLDRRARLLKAFGGLPGIELVVPGDDDTAGGLVSSEKDAQGCIARFEKQKLDGIVLAVLGYGDEKSVLQVVERFKGLPVLLFAMMESIPQGGFLEGASVGGMLPISYGLHKRNVTFTFAGVFDPEDARLAGEVSSFARVCAAVGRLQRARIGMIGFRPYDFEVCIFNEGLLLERYGVKTVPLNLIDVEHLVAETKDGDPEVMRIVKEIQASFSPGCPSAELAKLAKLELVMLRWAKEYRLDALTIQCWSAIQEHIGLTPCLTNGRVATRGIPVACEGDAMGALSLLFQQWIGDEGGVPWLADILMLHPREKDLFLAWHCGNAHAGLASAADPAKLRGICTFPEDDLRGLATSELALRPGAVSANRIVEHHGVFKLLHVDGTVVTSEDRMRGSWGWIQVADRERLLRTAVEEGFVHHVSIVHGGLGARVKEAAKYLGMKLVLG
jgi:L-fucose isomerase-like protein